MLVHSRTRFAVSLALCVLESKPARLDVRTFVDQLRRSFPARIVAQGEQRHGSRTVQGVPELSPASLAAHPSLLMDYTTLLELANSSLHCAAIQIGLESRRWQLESSMNRTRLGSETAIDIFRELFASFKDVTSEEATRKQSLEWFLCTLEVWKGLFGETERLEGKSEVGGIVDVEMEMLAKKVSIPINSLVRVFVWDVVDYRRSLNDLLEILSSSSSRIGREILTPLLSLCATRISAQAESIRALDPNHLSLSVFTACLSSARSHIHHLIEVFSSSLDLWVVHVKRLEEKEIIAILAECQDCLGASLAGYRMEEWIGSEVEVKILQVLESLWTLSEVYTSS